MSEERGYPRRLVRDSEWLRRFQIGPETHSTESKFATGEMQVSLDSIQRRWPALSPRERIEFAQAYVAQDPENVDHRILDFLMDQGPELVWLTIALCLQIHPDRERVLSFLLARLEQPASLKLANYYQAIAALKDKRAIKPLRRHYESYRDRLPGLKEDPSLLDDLLDYVSCCAALFRLEGSPEFRSVLEEMSQHSDQIVRCQASYGLQET